MYIYIHVTYIYICIHFVLFCQVAFDSEMCFKFANIHHPTTDPIFGAPNSPEFLQGETSTIGEASHVADFGAPQQKGVPNQRDKGLLHSGNLT